jgi:hypothetical protein
MVTLFRSFPTPVDKAAYAVSEEIAAWRPPAINLRSGFTVFVVKCVNEPVEDLRGRICLIIVLAPLGKMVSSCRYSTSHGAVLGM